VEQAAESAAGDRTEAASRFRLRGTFAGNELAVMFRRTRNIALLAWDVHAVWCIGPR